MSANQTDSKPRRFSGGGGRGGRGNNRAPAASIGTKKGACEALGAHVFGHGQQGSADQMQNTWKAIIKHVAVNVGAEISTELSTCRTVTIPAPVLSTSTIVSTMNGVRGVTFNGNGDSNTGSRCHHANNNTLSKTDAASVFQRVAERRGYEMSTLELSQCRRIFQTISEWSGETLTPAITTTTEASKTVQAFLNRQYETICNANTLSEAKRRAHDLASELFRLIDEELKKKEATTSTTTTTTTTVVASQDGEKRHEKRSRKKRKLSANRVSLQAETAAAAAAVAVDSVLGATPAATTTTTNISNGASTAAASTNRPNQHEKPRNDIGAPTALNGSQNNGAISTAVSRNPVIISTSLNNANGGASAGTTTSKNKVRSIASLSAASATTAAIALESTEPGELSSTARAITNVAAARAGNIPIAPPPAYEERSSNALAQRELQSRQREKGNLAQTSTTATAGAKATSNANGNRKQPPPSSTTTSIGSTNGRLFPLITEEQNNGAAPSVASAAGVQRRFQSTGARKTTSSTALEISTGEDTAGSTTTTTRTTTPVKSNDSERPTDGTEVATASTISSIGVSSGNGAVEDMDMSDDEDDPTPPQLPIPSSQTEKISFSADLGPSSFSGAVDSRAGVHLEYNRNLLTKAQLEIVADRLTRWEPFWEVKKVLATGVTSQINRKEYLFPRGNAKDATKTAGSFKVSYVWNAVKDFLNSNKGPTGGEKPKDGEYQILVRMLPLNVPEKLKKQRADCHLWPLGTYLQITQNEKKYPQTLVQRKQQAHDPTKWQGISKHLNVTPFVQCKQPSALSFEMCSYDEELYIFSLTLCRFRMPKTLLEVSFPETKRPSLNASFAKIKKMMKNNEVSLDVEEEKNDVSNKLRHSVFSLQDRSLKTAITTPVRGRKCRHLSCFDCEAFLQLHQNINGQRWKCTNCELFLSLEDLEYCALSKHALDLFKVNITSTRHMVEVREDGEMDLLDPQRSRAERERARNGKKKKPQGDGNNNRNGNISQRGEPEIIEIDSD